jgi:excisionase family DNA binding protein
MRESDALLKISEVAKLLNCNVRTVWRLLRSGELTRVHVGARITRVWKSDVIAYLEQRNALVKETL